MRKYTVQKKMEHMLSVTGDILIFSGAGATLDS